MIKLLKTGSCERTITYSNEDNIDAQDLVYRLKTEGYYTDFLKSQQGSNRFVYCFVSPMGATIFESVYRKNRKKIMDEKKWRSRI